MTCRKALSAAVRRLADISDTPRLDAELLMAHALGIGRESLLLSRLDNQGPETFEPLLRRREAGEPVAYITGRRAFWTVELEVGPGVLIPRPDSETLIEAAVDHFGKAGPRTVLDLGTGPGTLLLAALDQWPEARGLGIDRSEKALALAGRNAGRLGLAGRARFRLGDWGEGVEERFDLILCNPPYVEDSAELPGEVSEWEPSEALFAGPEGLDDYRRLAPRIGRLLTEGGIACVEIGAAQATAVTALLEAEGLKATLRQDLGGRPRCLVIEA
ncbi:peptide chain release factor N(5)-glutamine methyltransferase [Allosphingosinicella sp.]|uniref:peptide chain release factor N(5)-glutamine methyltransferase n=1 Tax=Allosphingosinicella sp. TaxID=2823234 RepID=UPI003D76051A